MIINVTTTCLRNSGSFYLAPLRFAQCCGVHALAVDQKKRKEDQLIHVSILRTDKFQRSLPRLPIPKIEHTLDRYLDSQRALLPAESQELRYTESCVKDFEKSGVGVGLDRTLRQRDKANKHTSYVADFWYDYYLKSRTPIVFNSNPFIMMKDDTRPDYSDQLVRATNLIVSSLRFRNAHQENCLDPDVFHVDEKKTDTQRFRKIIKLTPDRIAWYMAYFHKAFPLDMSQYPRLFASTRVPQKKRDLLTSHPDARHIVVIRNGQFYTFDVYEADGRIVNPQLIYANLKHISMQSSDDKASSLHLGLLTTMDRDTWADVRKHMVKNLGNESALAAIDSALFAMCLDGKCPANVPDTIRHFLCGDPAYRWFDKCFQLIVTPTGQAAVNFEHSWGDGIAVLRYINEVRGDSTKKPSISMSSISSGQSAEGIKRLDFQLDARVIDALTSAKAALQKTIAKFEVSMARQPSLNRADVKAANFSPDAIMQLVLQLAYYRLTGGGVAPTYESCSTAAFRHGRTETIRSATCETRTACEMIGLSTSGGVSQSIVEAVRQASAKHSQLTKDAAMGQGWDRHLMALRLLAEMGIEAKCHDAAAKGILYLADKDLSLPLIFKDPSFEKINHIILSTSTLSSPNIELGGFGPVVSDGFGLGYGINNEEAGCIVTSYKGDNKYSASDMSECVESAITSIANVVRAAKAVSPKPKKK